MDKYPYFIYPDVVALHKGNLTEEERKRIVRKIALNVGDEPSLRLILGIDSSDMSQLYPDMSPETPSTLDTIDTFLGKFGNAKPTAYQFEEPEQETGEYDLPEEDNFIESEQNLQKKAQICIKNKRYKEALEIITSLNLKNPEKSVYFAHQIRFLRKLLLNEAYKNKIRTQKSGN